MVCATCGRKSHEVARCYRDIARWWSSRPRDKLSISTPKSAPFTGPRTNTTQIAVTTPLIHANVAALTDADRQGKDLAVFQMLNGKRVSFNLTKYNAEAVRLTMSHGF